MPRAKTPSPQAMQLSAGQSISSFSIPAMHYSNPLTSISVATPLIVISTFSIKFSLFSFCHYALLSVLVPSGVTLLKYVISDSKKLHR